VGVGLHDVEVSGHAVILPSTDFEVRYVRESGQGVLVRLWMSTAGGYGFGAIDLGYIYQIPSLGSKDMGVVLNLMAGPSIADANGCDAYDDYFDENGNDCAGPSLSGSQLGGFVSPSLGIHLGHFTASLTPIYRFFRQGGHEKVNTQWLGVTLGLGLGFY
jgi:hypothetical protein